MFARTPRPPLSTYVQMLWMVEGYRCAHALDRILPDGETGLVINLAENVVRVYDAQDTGRVRTMGGSVAVGPFCQPFVIDTAEQADVLGAVFKVGGAFALFRLPAAELANQHVPLEFLWGAFARSLKQEIADASGADRKLAVLEKALLQQARNAEGPHSAVRFSVQELCRAPDIPISTLSESAGISRRRLTQLFQEQVGLTPKLFGRVRRFHQVLGRLSASDEVDWADFAVHCGYYDQAHLIHEFQQLSGMTPGAYLPLASRRVGHHLPMID